MKLHFLFAFVLGLISAASSSVHAVSMCKSTPTRPAARSAWISLASQQIVVSGNMSVNYVVPANQVDKKNWIAVFPSNTSVPNATEFKKLNVFAYAPVQSGKVGLDTSKLKPGAYKVWMLAKDGYATVLAGPESLTVVAAANAQPTQPTGPSTGPAASISVPSPAVNVGGTVTISYSVLPSQVHDKNWIAVFPVGAPAPSPQEFRKHNIYQYAGAQNGRVTLDTRSLPPGTYKVWLLAKDGYTTVLDGPKTFTVVAATPQGSNPNSRPTGVVIAPVSSTLRAGNTLDVNYSMAPNQANGKNWIGVFPANSPSPSANDFKSVGVFSYAPSQQGRVSLNTRQLAPGRYKLWLLANDGYTSIGGPVSVEVLR